MKPLTLLNISVGFWWEKHQGRFKTFGLQEILTDKVLFRLIFKPVNCIIWAAFHSKPALELQNKHYKINQTFFTANIPEKHLQQILTYNHKLHKRTHWTLVTDATEYFDHARRNDSGSLNEFYKDQEPKQGLEPTRKPSQHRCQSVWTIENSCYRWATNTRWELNPLAQRW